jgi:hypothetical protein
MQRRVITLKWSDVSEMSTPSTIKAMIVLMMKAVSALQPVAYCTIPG